MQLHRMFTTARSPDGAARRRRPATGRITHRPAPTSIRRRSLGRLASDLGGAGQVIELTRLIAWQRRTTPVACNWWDHPSTGANLNQAPVAWPPGRGPGRGRPGDRARAWREGSSIEGAWDIPPIGGISCARA